MDYSRSYANLPCVDTLGESDWPVTTCSVMFSYGNIHNDIKYTMVMFVQNDDMTNKILA